MIMIQKLDQAEAEKKHLTLNPKPEPVNKDCGYCNPYCSAAGKQRIMTRAEGAKVQGEHLDEWKVLLKPEVWSKLYLRCVQKNSRCKCGHEYVRGQQIYEILMNDIRREV